MVTKTTSILIFILFIATIATANAETLFFEDFESDLLNWTLGNGVIVDDPNDPESGNSALHFVKTKGGGDIFSVDTFFSSSGPYTLSFDYFGLVDGIYSGGFIGHTGAWLAGSSAPDQYKSLTKLPDTGEWEQISVSFNYSKPITLMIEDFLGIAGDAYFDNIMLTDGNGPSPTVPTPEPATLALLGTGLIGMVLYGRKKKMFNN